MDDLKDQLSNLIENNKIDKAIVILKEESAKRGGQLDHIIISLSSRYKRYREKSLMGLEARDQEFTKIVSDTLELVKALDNPSTVLKTEEEASYSAPRKEVTSSAPPPAPQSNKYVLMGIGGLAVIGLIALISVFAGGDDEAGYDPNSEYDTYIEPAGAGQGAYPDFYNLAGNWQQVAQSFGPENDCPSCTITITQDGSIINVVSNVGWYASLEFINEYGLYEGSLNWGDLSPGDVDQAVQMYLDENDELVVLTMIQGSEYTMYFAE